MYNREYLSEVIARRILRNSAEFSVMAQKVLITGAADSPQRRPNAPKVPIVPTVMPIAQMVKDAKDFKRSNRKKTNHRDRGYQEKYSQKKI
jgi:hypothetical protein